MKFQATRMPVTVTGRPQSVVLPTILLLLLQLVAPFLQRLPSVVQAAASPPVTSPPTKAESAARVAEKLGQMPMTFEQNLGQTAARVKFTARGQGYQLFLTPSEAMLSLPQGKHKRPLALRMQLVGGNPNPVVTGLEQTGTVSNYYLGHDPSKFRTGVPHFARVKYAQVYPGIDAVYYGNQRNLEYDFLVAPGVDPRVIQMTFKGAKNLRLDSNGDLVIQTKGGELRHHKPVIYQDVNGTRQAVAGSFKLRGQQVGFAIGDYDRTKELVIDPTLNYSTYLGGYDGDEKGYAITLDSSNNAYLTGEVASTGEPAFPDEDIAGESNGGKDIFVAKLLADGSDIDFYTFIGGAGDEWGTAIGRNTSTGDILVAGIFGTNSYDPGATIGAYARYDPSTTTDDAFVLRLTSAGALDKFTYLGGNGLDKANGIAVDGDNVFVVGHTFSSNFPTNGTNTAYNTSHGGQADVFVTKLTSNLGSLNYSTYIGGTNNDYGMAMALQSGYVYLTGYSQSSNFPTNSAFDNTITGFAPVDAIVVKLNPGAGTSGLTYSTYLGGNGREEGLGIAVNSSGEAFVTGRTHSAGESVSGYTASSTGFPYTAGAAQTSQAGAGDVFMTKLNSSGNGLGYSTLLGGGDQDTGYSIALDSNSKILITGETDSTDFPLTSQLQADQTGTDAFIARINPAGSGSDDREFSTYFGGGSADSGRGIAASSTVAYITGFTSSASDQYGGYFKVAPSGSIYQDEVAGGFDAFAAKITP